MKAHTKHKHVAIRIKSNMKAHTKHKHVAIRIESNMKTHTKHKQVAIRIKSNMKTYKTLTRGNIKSDTKTNNQIMGNRRISISNELLY